jgi:hypothetical protein
MPETGGRMDDPESAGLNYPPGERLWSTCTLTLVYALGAKSSFANIGVVCPGVNPLGF